MSIADDIGDEMCKAALLKRENDELKVIIRDLAKATRGLFPFTDILVAEFDTTRFADRLNAALDKAEATLDAIPKGVFNKQTETEED